MTVEKKSHKGISLWRVLSVKGTYPLPAPEATTVFLLFPKTFFPSLLGGWTFDPGLCSQLPMTPAINAAQKANISFTVREYAHDPACQSYGMEAAEKLEADPARVFKTLIADLGGELVVAVIPVEAMLVLKHLAKACGAKKATMADKTLVQRITGYVLGGVSPLGQKKRLRTFIDVSAQAHPTILVSAGRRGLEIELDPEDLCRLINGRFAPLIECSGS